VHPVLRILLIDQNFSFPIYRLTPSHHVFHCSPLLLFHLLPPCLLYLGHYGIYHLSFRVLDTIFTLPRFSHVFCNPANIFSFLLSLQITHRLFFCADAILSLAFLLASLYLFLSLTADDAGGLQWRPCVVLDLLLLLL